MKYVLISLIVLLSVAAAVLAWSDTYDTATPVGTNAPSVLDDKDREIKGAVQERENIDHYWPLTGTQVSDADAGMHRRVTFQSQLATPTLAADQAMLYTQDYDGGAGAATELVFHGEGDLPLQVTELNTAGTASALNITGTYENEVNFSNTANSIYADVIACTSAGYLTLPIDTTDTTEGNLRYDDTGDTVSYRSASAWAPLALASVAEFSCSGSADGNVADMVIDIGFAPGFILAWSDVTTAQSLWWWSATESTANYTFGGQVNVQKKTTTDRSITVSSTSVTFPAAGSINNSGEKYHYIAISATNGTTKNPAVPSP